MGTKNKKEEADYKWRFGIGTTSRVPYLGGHYLMLDIDGKPNWQKLVDFASAERRRIVVQKTEHGYHIYTDFRSNLLEVVCHLAKQLGADERWINIAKKRGYLFLADKDRIELPWPVERMIIHRGKEKRKTLNTR